MDKEIHCFRVLKLVTVGKSMLVLHFHWLKPILMITFDLNSRWTNTSSKWWSWIVTSFHRDVAVFMFRATSLLVLILRPQELRVWGGRVRQDRGQVFCLQTAVSWTLSGITALTSGVRSWAVNLLPTLADVRQEGGNIVTQIEQISAWFHARSVYVENKVLTHSKGKHPGSGF